MIIAPSKNIDPMLETMEKSYQVRNAKIEALYKRLDTAKTPEEEQEILQEIELVTGLKLIFN